MGALQIISNLVEFIRSFFRAAFGRRDEGQHKQQHYTEHGAWKREGNVAAARRARLCIMAALHHQRSTRSAGEETELLEL